MSFLVLWRICLLSTLALSSVGHVFGVSICWTLTPATRSPPALHHPLSFGHPAFIVLLIGSFISFLASVPYSSLNHPCQRAETSPAKGLHSSSPCTPYPNPTARAGGASTSWPPPFLPSPSGWSVASSAVPNSAGLAALSASSSRTASGQKGFASKPIDTDPALLSVAHQPLVGFSFWSAFLGSQELGPWGRK